MNREFSHNPPSLAPQERLLIENALTDYEQACTRHQHLTLPSSLVALPGLEGYAQMLRPTTLLNVLADLAWKTGLRTSEALQLPWLDVGFEDGWLTFVFIHHGDRLPSRVRSPSLWTSWSGCSGSARPRRRERMSSPIGANRACQRIGSA